MILRLSLLLALAVGMAQASSCISLLFLGDWGSPEVNKVTPSLAKAIHSDCTDGGLFLLGDNFYPNGVASVDDPLWEQIFVGPFADVNTSMYVIAGNHDHHQPNIDAQLAYQDPRWNFPSPYYAKTFQSGNVSVLALQLDTWDLVGGDSEHGNKIEDTKQLQWLREQLASSSHYDYVIVNGHYPIRNLGERGDTQGLVNDLLPVLQESNIAAYIFGHAHVLQHLEEDGLLYVGSGVGGRKEDDARDENGRAVFYSGEHYGFVSMQFHPQFMSVHFHQIIHGEDVIVHTVTVPKKEQGTTTNGGTLLRMRLRQALKQQEFTPTSAADAMVS